MDLAGRKDGEDKPTYAESNELVLQIKGIKTDQYNFGATRNQFETREELCVLQAAREYERCYPERTRGSERGLALRRLQDGSYLKREVVQHYLRLAAMAQGYDGDKMGSHSLRIGGATAMYHTTSDLIGQYRCATGPPTSTAPGGSKRAVALHK